MSRTRNIGGRKPNQQRAEHPAGFRPPDRQQVPSGGVTVVQETAEIVYNAFVTYLREHGDPAKAPTKRWNQLSQIDRAAWRTANNIIRIMTLGTALLPIPKPEGHQATVTICDGNAWQSTQVNRDEIPTSTIATLMAAIDKAYEEDPKQKRPQENDSADTAGEDAGAE